jgi:energy-converting hydrogenase Eha subunit F
MQGSLKRREVVKRIFVYWLSLAILISGLAWLPYGLVQQDLRQNANDPQIQLAEDSAAKLNAGQQVQQVVPTDQVDIASSLAPYIIVFDTNGKPIASSGQLNGQAPSIPSGVFDSVRQNGEDRITWQPQSGVRSALVVTQFKGGNGGFVAAGRSLREVEQREDNIMQIVIIGWLALLAVSLAATAIVFWPRLKKTKQ